MSADTDRSSRRLRAVLWVGRVLSAVILAVTVVVVVAEVLTPGGGPATAAE